MSNSDKEIFFHKAYILCNSIISRRLLMLSLDKSKFINLEQIRITTKDLEKDFNKNNLSCCALAFFISNNYIRLFSVIPMTAGLSSNRIKLSELYKQSLLINKSNVYTGKS